MTAQHADPNLGQLIRARRIALGMSQEALAVRVSDLGSEINQSDISRIELGKVDLPRRRRLEHLAAALELSLGELLEASGWVGASERFGTDAITPSSPPDSPGGTPVAARVSDRPAWASPGQVTIDSPATMEAVLRLRTAVVVSQDSVARATQLLKDCQETARRWDLGSGRSRDTSRHGASSAGDSS